MSTKVNGHNHEGGVQRVELRRYPNRRYYDSTRSQHLTLEGIYRLVQDGFEVRISDSKSGEDITAKVLAQLILEHDPPKLAAFPAELLHQIIRSNESLLRGFVEKYFTQALSAFLRSQQEFERYMRETLGLQHVPPVGRAWMEMMMGPLALAFGPSRAATPLPLSASSSDGSPSVADLQQTVEELRQEVAALREALSTR